MKTWIDNTGLHAAAQCLAGTASPSHDYHVRGLLQLATLVIFSDSISVNGFEDPLIARRSAEMLHRLESAGIGKGVISISPVNEAEYALACQTAAMSVTTDVSDSFSASERVLVGGGPPDLPRGLRERQVAAISLCRE